VRSWNLPDAEAGGFTIALQVGLALAYLFFGFLSDRRGHKLSLEICMAVSVLSLVLALFAPSALWFFPIFFLRGAVNAGTFVSGIPIVYEFTDAESRPIYIGLANTIPGVAGSIAPLVGGWLAGTISYQAMFTLATVIGVISWIILRFAVREPRNVSAATGDLGAGSPPIEIGV
jgi:MFS family permease